MYTPEDMNDINGRIRKNAIVLAVVLAVLLAVYIYALAVGMQWLAMLSGALLAMAACYGGIGRLAPLLRYRRFLRQMSEGLSRNMSGVLVEISNASQMQDGALVLPVRLRLDPDSSDKDSTRRQSVAARRLNRLPEEEDTRDERILYLNASKRDRMPEAGAHVTLDCFGRHIRAVTAYE